MKNLVKAAVAVAVAGVGAWFLSNQIQTITNSLLEKKKLAVILEHRSDTVRKLRDDFVTVGTTDKQVESAFVPEDNILDFTGALEANAKAAGMSQSLNFATPVASTLGNADLPLSTISYTIGLGGSVDTLITYLKNFETLPYFTQISDIQIQAPGGWLGNSDIHLNAVLWAKQAVVEQ